MNVNIDKKDWEIFLPPAPSKPKKNPWFVVGGILGAIVVVMTLIGLTIYAVNVSSDLKDEQAETARLTGKVEDLTGKMNDMKEHITAVEIQNSSLTSRNTDLQNQVSGLNKQLTACAIETSISVKMDNILHDLIRNALLNGSLSEWNSLYDQYNRLGNRWVTAANACDTTGGYSFE